MPKQRRQDYLIFCYTFMLKYDILEIEHAFHEIALQTMLAMNHNFSLHRTEIF